MNRAFRKYHRQIAIVASLPLILTVISGVGYTIFDEWFEQEEISTFLLKLHTLEIIHLGKFFPILNGVALIALLVTGLSMTTLFNKRRPSEKSSN